MRRILDEMSPSAKDATAEGIEAEEAVAIVLTLIALTVLFEKMKHAAEHRAGRALRHVVEALFGELTVLGFLSMMTYLANVAGSFAALSRRIFGEEDEEEEVFELVEEIHFAMFFVMVVFLVSVLFEVHHGLQSQKEWNQWDRACHDEAYVQSLLRKSAKSDEEYDAVSSIPGLRGMTKRTWRFLLPYLRFLPFLSSSRDDLVDKMEFCSLRLEFMKERSADPPFAPAGEEGGNPKTIGDHFNFGRYLTHVYAKKMAHVVEIDVTTWLFFAGATICYFLLFDALGFSLKELAWVWVIIGWVFHVLSINFEKYLLGIRDRFIASQFVPKPKRRQLSWGVLSSTDDESAISGTEKEPLQMGRTTANMLGKNNFRHSSTMESDGLPMWCYIDIAVLDQSRNKLAKIMFGPTSQNRQHALYLFGHRGPAFHILCLRIMLVFSCLYSAQLVILFVPMMARDEGTTTLVLITYCVLAFVPALAFIFNKKRLIASLIQVGSIGPFVMPHAISESEREEKTSMAVRVLVIYYKLARMTEKFLANSSALELAPTGCHYTDALSLEETAELGRMFRLFFDLDGDGTLTGSDFQSLMISAGMTLTKSEADELIRAIVKSTESAYVEPQDTEGDKIGLSTHAFFQWYANQLGDADDKKECAKFLFRLFDDDGSGDVTALEFKQTLDKLAIGISHEDADELLEELDEDGNGVLCEEEFEDLIEHFYPVEFQHRSENTDVSMMILEEVKGYV